ncbi:MAG TPA: IPT/TIG domain-containing protein [Blastocatellia bacterium]|nr:IPT/TIG domain-containing protein [Blastocatellia bacterium]
MGIRDRLTKWLTATNDPGDQRATPRESAVLAAYLILVAAGVIFSIYLLWPRCEIKPKAGVNVEQQQQQSQASSAVSPQNGPVPGGTRVRIKGEGFSTTSPLPSVSFGALPGTDVAFESALSILATTPAHPPGTVEVKVQKAGETEAKVYGSYQYLEAPSAPSAVSPQSGPVVGGTKVRIMGTGFSPAAPLPTVLFGTDLGTQVAFESSVSILVTTPAHPPGPVEVKVQKSGETEARIYGNYRYLDSPPTVTTVTPNSGTIHGNTQVKILGTNFIKDAKVSFGGTLSESAVVDSITSITARLPEHTAGKVDVVVINGDDQVAIKSEAFTYNCPVQPGSCAFLMVLCAGALGGALHAMRSLGNFVGSRDLKRSWKLYYVMLPWTGGMIAVVFYLIIGAGFLSPESTSSDSTAIVVGLAAVVGLFSEAAMEKLKKIAEALLTSPEKRPDQIGEIPVPKLERLTPDKGKTAGGDEVTLEGSSFAANAEVTFDGRGATVIGRTGDTSIIVRALAPLPGKKTAEVVVKNPDPKNPEGKTSAPKTYEYDDTGSSGVTGGTVPSISSLIPPNGPTSGQNTVAIEGTGFAAGLKVRFGDIEVPDAKRESNTRIVVNAPAHAKDEKVNVVVVSPDGKASAPFVYTYETAGTPPVGGQPPAGSAELTIKAITPASGKTTGGEPVTIEGTGFDSKATVKFGESEAVVGVTSSASINATTPKHDPGDVVVTVTNPDKKQATQKFTYTQPEGG